MLRSPDQLVIKIKQRERNLSLFLQLNIPMENQINGTSKRHIPRNTSDLFLLLAPSYYVLILQTSKMGSF